MSIRDNSAPDVQVNRFLKTTAMLVFSVIYALFDLYCIFPLIPEAGQNLGVLLVTLIPAFVFMTFFELRYGEDSLWKETTPKPPKEIVMSPDQTVLEAEHYRLTEIHMEELLNLRELTRINLGLNQLKAIDLSLLRGSTSLKELILYMNHLEAIDLSPLASCPNLEYLDLTDNDLESLDLTPLASCANLDALNIGMNETEGIDLSPLSECRNLRILTLDGMELREVDLSPLENCPKLEFLKLDDNKLISLDVTPLFGCKSLTDFPIDSIDLTATLIRAIEDWPEGIRKHAKRFRKS